MAHSDDKLAHLQVLKQALEGQAQARMLARTSIWLQHICQKVQDLAAGQALGEGLDGMAPVQEDDCIPCLHARTQPLPPKIQAQPRAEGHDPIQVLPAPNPVQLE